MTEFDQFANRINKVKDDFNKSAAHYDKFASLQQQTTKQLLTYSKERLANVDNILDLGCGPGYFIEHARAILSNTLIIQLDLSLNMCKLAQSLGPVVNADLDRLCFADNIAGGAFSNLVLQWSPNITGSLRQVNKILRPNGYFCFSTFGPKTLTELNYCFAKIDSLNHINQFHTQEQLRASLLDAGFINIEFITDEISLFFPNSLALMHYLKKLGANKKTGINNSLTRNKLLLIEQIYQQSFGREDGISSTWQIFYIMAQV